MHGQLRQIYELFVDDDRYSVPTLKLVSADNEAAAIVAAQKVLAESPHHVGVEVSLHGQRLAGLGSFATRRVPPEAQLRGAQA
jgi:hypothetical protein